MFLVLLPPRPYQVSETKGRARVRVFPHVRECDDCAFCFHVLSSPPVILHGPRAAAAALSWSGELCMKLSMAAPPPSLTFFAEVAREEGRRGRQRQVVENERMDEPAVCLSTHDHGINILRRQIAAIANEWLGGYFATRIET